VSQKFHFIKTEIFSGVSYDSSVMSKTSHEFCVCRKDGPTSPAAEQLPTPVFIGLRVFHKTLENFPCTIIKYAITWLPTLPWIKSQPGVWVTPLFYTVWYSSFCFTCTVNRNVFKIFATLRDISFCVVYSSVLSWSLSAINLCSLPCHNSARRNTLYILWLSGHFQDGPCHRFPCCFAISVLCNGWDC